MQYKDFSQGRCITLSYEVLINCQMCVKSNQTTESVVPCRAKCHHDWKMRATTLRTKSKLQGFGVWSKRQRPAASQWHYCYILFKQNSVKVTRSLHQEHHIVSLFSRTVSEGIVILSNPFWLAAGPDKSIQAATGRPCLGRAKLPA